MGPDSPGDGVCLVNLLDEDASSEETGDQRLATSGPPAKSVGIPPDVQKTKLRTPQTHVCKERHVSNITTLSPAGGGPGGLPPSEEQLLPRPPQRKVAVVVSPTKMISPTTPPRDDKILKKSPPPPSSSEVDHTSSSHTSRASDRSDHRTTPAAAPASPVTTWKSPNRRLLHQTSPTQNGGRTTSSPRTPAAVRAEYEQNVDVWARLEEEEERQFLLENSTVSTLEGYLQRNFPTNSGGLQGSSPQKSRSSPSSDHGSGSTGGAHLLSPGAPPASPKTSNSIAGGSPPSFGGKTPPSAAAAETTSPSRKNHPSEHCSPETTTAITASSSRSGTNTGKRRGHPPLKKLWTSELGFEFDFDRLSEPMILKLLERIKKQPNFPLPRLRSIPKTSTRCQAHSSKTFKSAGTRGRWVLVTNVGPDRVDVYYVNIWPLVGHNSRRGHKSYKFVRLEECLTNKSSGA